MWLEHQPWEVHLGRELGNGWHWKAWKQWVWRMIMGRAADTFEVHYKRTWTHYNNCRGSEEGQWAKAFRCQAVSSHVLVRIMAHKSCLLGKGFPMLISPNVFVIVEHWQWQTMSKRRTFLQKENWQPPDNKDCFLSVTIFVGCKQRVTLINFNYICYYYL